VALAEPNPYRRSLLRQKRSVDTRRAIVRAAARLWSEKDYDETTVEEICAAAGIARSTYYLHFTSKEELLTELSVATARGVALDVEAAEPDGSIATDLQVFINGLVRRMNSVPRSLAAVVMRRVSLGLLSGRPDPNGPVLFEHVLAEIVRRAQSRREIPQDIDAADIGEVLAGMTLDALERWAGGNTERSLDESLSLRFDLVLAAIVRP
jgi:AcrR family transcriptional regulator